MIAGPSPGNSVTGRRRRGTEKEREAGIRVFTGKVREAGAKRLL
mgnify:CR=1 FL=1